MDLKEQDILGDSISNHWYYVTKGRAMRSLLGGFHTDEVLDVGAGSGVFSRQLLDARVCERATCVDPGYEAERVETYHGAKLSFVRSAPKGRHGLVLMMDVLEHVDDDVALLRQYARGIPADGRVLISVPAFQFLWSGHDVFLEHRRRYTRAMLERTVTDAGLVVERSRYFFGLLFPVIAAMRIVQGRRARRGQVEARSDLRNYGTVVNGALTWLHGVERRVVFPFNTVAGLTLFCLARPRVEVRSAARDLAPTGVGPSR
jgi:SAM-dependent methyltransferase